MFAYCRCSREEVAKGVRRHIQRAFYAFFGKRLTHNDFRQIVRVAQVVSIRCFDYYRETVPKEEWCDSGVITVFTRLYNAREYGFLCRTVAHNERLKGLPDYPVVTLLQSSKKEEIGRALDIIAFAGWLYFSATKEYCAKFHGPWQEERKCDLYIARNDCLSMKADTKHRHLLEEIRTGKKENTEPVKTVAVDRSFIRNMLQYLDKRIIGQDRAKRAVAGCCYKYLRYGERDPLLLFGPTGSGKTFLIRCAMDFMKEAYGEKIQFAYKNISRVTPEGWSGEDPSTALELFEKVNGDKYYFVQLDEIDKVMHPSTNHAGEDVHKELQEQIMNILDGSDNLSGVDWSRVLIICTGAFSRLDAIRRERMMLAFPELELSGMAVGRKPQPDIRDLLVSGGVSPEMIGRFSQIEQLNKLGKDDIRRILLLKKGPLSTIRAAYAREGIRLLVDDDGLDAIVDRIVEQNLGARSCSSVLNALVGPQRLVEAILDDCLEVQIDGECRVVMKRKELL